MILTRAERQRRQQQRNENHQPAFQAAPVPRRMTYRVATARGVINDPEMGFSHWEAAIAWGHTMNIRRQWWVEAQVGTEAEFRAMEKPVRDAILTLKDTE